MISDTDQSSDFPPSGRTKVRRGASRAQYGPEQVRAILRAGQLAHVAANTGDCPIVLPMAYGIDDNKMYLHGAIGNALLRGGESTEVCATVTILDGLVLARSAFHHSMNYRSVVVLGIAQLVTDEDEKVAGLKAVTNHVVSRWDDSREPSEAELKATKVLSLAIDEASAKVRTGGPIDEPEDLDGPWWAGTLPRVDRWLDPVDSPDIASPTPVPDAVALFRAET